MQVRLIIILLFLHASCLAQDNGHVKKYTWEDLQLRHQREEESYNARLKKDYGGSDTTTTPDSILINFILKSGTLVKQIVYLTDTSGCRRFVKYNYFDRNERLVYSKRHPITCAAMKGEPDFHPVHYERFEYDKMGRLVLYVDTWADRPYRVEYNYAADGEVRRTSRKIHWTDFWK